MTEAKDLIRIRGQKVAVDQSEIAGVTVVVRGKLLKIARIKDEWIEPLYDPERVLEGLNDLGRRIDIFSFVQHVGPNRKCYPYYAVPENLAIIPVTTFDTWWKCQIDAKTRNQVRKAEKKGVIVRAVPFNDELVSSIMTVYNESRTRQGKQFWHYGKRFDEVKMELADRIDRSVFLGAYDGAGCLLGFIKLILGDTWASIVVIVSMISARDKAPNNALISAAIKECELRQKSTLIYAHLSYGRKGRDSLAEFKLNNGFQELKLKRYWVPRTPWGALALRFGLERDLSQAIPPWLLRALLRTRAKVMTYSADKTQSRPKSPGG